MSLKHVYPALALIIWMFDTSVSSEISFARFSAAFNIGIGFVPGWFIKLVALALIWAYLHHFIAGVRHLWMDATHSVTKEFGRSSAVVTLAASVLLTAVLGGGYLLWLMQLNTRVSRGVGL